MVWTCGKRLVVAGVLGLFVGALVYYLWLLVRLAQAVIELLWWVFEVRSIVVEHL